MKRCLEVDHHSDAAGFASRLLSQKVDLNGDRHADYLLNPGNACSGIGVNNVPLFAYIWTLTGYRLVLMDGGLSVEAGKNLNNGYRTIIIEAHASGNDVDITHYKFTGSTYQPFRCLTRKYDDLRHRFTKLVRRLCEE